jgi:hypothetical protein
LRVPQLHDGGWTPSWLRLDADGRNADTRHSDPPVGFAMAVAVLIGHGDADVLKLLPATVSADRVALVGLHAWAEDDIGNVAD